MGCFLPEETLKTDQSDERCCLPRLRAQDYAADADRRQARVDRMGALVGIASGKPERAFAKRSVARSIGGGSKNTELVPT